MKRMTTTQSGGRKPQATAETSQWQPQEPARPARQTSVSSSMPSWTRYIDSRMKQFAAGR